MTLAIFPTSPVPGNTTKTVQWNEHAVTYDSGRFQGSTNWQQPLHQWNIPFKNFPETKINSIRAFWNQQKGQTTPFLFKDPYEYEVQAVTLASTTTMANGSGFYFYDANSYRVLPDSANFVVVCGTSGALVAGTDYTASLDNGFITTLVSPTSVWTASGQYYRKVHFEAGYEEKSPIWNIFNGGVTMMEIIP